jgi:hypothetical protein
MPNHLITYLASEPGINRDTTPFDSTNYTDGKWVRFNQQGKPVKIGGYYFFPPDATPGVDLTEIIRTIVVSPFDLTVTEAFDAELAASARNKALIIYGRASSISTAVVDVNNILEPEINITPADLVLSDQNVWYIDFFTTYDLDLNPINNILALCNPNLDNINGNTNGVLYTGVVTSNTVLIPVETGNAPPDTEYVMASGDVVAVPPFAVVLGNNGTVRWSEVNNLESWPVDNKAAITSTKLIKGFEVVGTTSPTFICWSLDSVIKCTYDEASEKFLPNVIENTISVLSPHSIVKAYNQFFWVGTSQFYQFNGIVQPWKNSMNKDYFFNRLNFAQRTKVFAIHLPRWNEIWIFYPSGDSVENDSVLIHNYAVNDGIWYDDDSIGRAAGASTNLFQRPLLTSNTTIPNYWSAPLPGEQPQQIYGTWLHEYGTDQVVYVYRNAIESYVTSHYYTFFANAPDKDFQFKTLKFEPDVYNQIGNMTLQLLYKGYANQELTQSAIKTWSPTTPYLSLSIQGRQMAFKISSNELGGYYKLGKCIIQNTLGDERQGT